MAPRASHIPHAIERSALQKLIAVGPLPFFKLHPAGRGTVDAMVGKGWLTVEGQNYKITEAGEAAFKAPIPMRRNDENVR